jgi:hypothetical protein
MTLFLGCELFEVGSRGGFAPTREDLFYTTGGNSPSQGNLYGPGGFDYPVYGWYYGSDE